ncbi:MAG: hypothetical protein H0T56_14485 [Pseudaminobacter sp.]|nr:hypothetical protein [Pseudaminobacter sp.]
MTVPLTRPDMHSAAKGQSLAQSGATGWASGQQGMSTGIDAISGAAIAHAVDGAAIGASASAQRTSGSRKRLRGDHSFIATRCHSAEGLNRLII